MVQLIEVHSDLRISDLYRLFFHERDSKTDLCEMGSDHRFNPSRCLGNTICRFCSPPHGASVPVPFARRPYFRSCCLALSPLSCFCASYDGGVEYPFVRNQAAGG